MKQIGDCPIGFADGHIAGYRAHADRLEVGFEFWNAKRGLLVFDGFVGARDQGAIGSEIGGVTQNEHSELIASLILHYYEVPPEHLDWKHFRFVDVNDIVIFEVVAPSCSFVEGLFLSPS